MKKILLSFCLLLLPIASCAKNEKITKSYDVSFISPTNSIDFHGENKATDDKDYEFYITVKDVETMLLPDNINVKINGADTDKFTYSNGSGKILKEDITGNIVITADAKEIPVLYAVTFKSDTLISDGEKTATNKNDYGCRIALKQIEKHRLPTSISVKVNDIPLNDGYKYDKDTGDITIYKEKINGNIYISAEATSIDEYIVTYVSDTVNFSGPTKLPLNTDLNVNLTVKPDYSDVRELPHKLDIRINQITLAQEKYTYNSNTGKLVIKAEHIVGDIRIIADAPYKTHRIILTELSVGLTLMKDGSSFDGVIPHGSDITFDICVGSRNLVHCPTNVDDIRYDDTSINDDEHRNTAYDAQNKKLTVTIYSSRYDFNDDIYIEAIPTNSDFTLLHYKKPIESITDDDYTVSFNFAKTSQSGEIAISWDESHTIHPIGDSASYTFKEDVKESYICISGDLKCITSFNCRDVSHYINNIDAVVFSNVGTEIAPDSFHQFRNLRYVGVLDNSPLTTIGDSAFDGCTNLSDVYFGKNSSLKTIGAKAFSFCGNVRVDAGIRDFKLPKTVTSIGDGAFQYCDNLRHFDFNNNTNITAIRKSTFRSCVNLRDISLPYSIRKIGDYAFANSGFNGVDGDLTIKNYYTYLGSYAFYNCLNVKRILFENRKASFENLPAGAFSYIPITSVAIPKGITSIGSIDVKAFYTDDGPFTGCDKLSSIDFASCDNLKAIGCNAFLGCSELTSTIVIPSKTFEFIGPGAFSYCDKLNVIDIISSTKLVPYVNNMFWLKDDLKLRVSPQMYEQYEQDENWKDHLNHIEKSSNI